MESSLLNAESYLWHVGSSSPARDQTQVPAIEIMKSWLLHHQQSPSSSNSKHHILTQKSKAEEGPSPLYDPFWDQGDHCQIPPADFPLYLIVWVCIICLLLITNKGSIITITGLLIKISLPQESLACVLSHFSHVWLCDPMDCSSPAPLSMEFSRHEYWSGLPCPPPGHPPNPGIQWVSLMSPVLAGVFLPPAPPGTWRAWQELTPHCSTWLLTVWPNLGLRKQGRKKITVECKQQACELWNCAVQHCRHI